MNQERGDCVATYLGLQAFKVVTVTASAPVRARSNLAHVSIRGSASAAPVGLGPVAVSRRSRASR